MIVLGDEKMKLVEYNDTYKSQLKSYKVGDETYTGLPQDAVIISQKNKNYHSILLINDLNEISTFFVLDYGEDKFKYTTATKSVLLRSFSTNEAFLRRGYALKTLQLLPNYIRNNYPAVKKIVLGVNEKNLAAQSLYEKAAFVKESQTYIGKKGKQFIFSKEI